MAGSALIGILLGVCFLTDPVTGTGVAEDSPLNYTQMIPLVEEKEQIMAVFCPTVEEETAALIQIGGVKGGILMDFLQTVDWRACRAPMDGLESPGSVEFLVQEEYRITVHKRKSGSLFAYAMVRYGEEKQYYRAKWSDYSKIVRYLEHYSGGIGSAES